MFDLREYPQDLQEKCMADLRKILEDIKAEINEKYHAAKKSNIYYAEGLEMAYEIISKHMRED